MSLQVEGRASTRLTRQRIRTYILSQPEHLAWLDGGRGAPPPQQFTVAEYYALTATGLVREEDRLELVDGVLVQMSPINDRHVRAVNRLNTLFHEQTGRDLIISVQNPLRLGTAATPQPDVLLFRPNAEDDDLPTPANVLLVIEVSDSTLAYDRRVKLALYAQAALAEVWIVNLVDNIIEVYTAPQEGQYSGVQTLGLTDTLTPVALPHVHILVDAIIR